MTELEKCLKAIYLELPEKVADDVNRIVNEAILSERSTQAELKAEVDKYKGMVLTGHLLEEYYAAIRVVKELRSKVEKAKEALKDAQKMMPYGLHSVDEALTYLEGKE